MLDGNILSHYTTYEKALIILNNGTLKVGTVSNVNDPRESKQWPFKCYCLDQKSEQIFKPDWFNEVSNFIKDRTHIICFTQNSKNYVRNDPPSGIIGSNITGISFANLRMWAQYGDNHKGICLLFDRESLNSTIRQVFANEYVFNRPIQYLNSTIQSNPILENAFSLYFEDMLRMGVDRYLTQHISKNFNGIFFTKSTEWSTEDEYRWVVFTKQKSNKDIFFPIKTSIRAIILGNDFVTEYQDKLIDISNDLNIPLFKIITYGFTSIILDVKQSTCDTYSLSGVSFNPVKIPFSTFYSQVHDLSGRQRTVQVKRNGINLEIGLTRQS